MSAVRVFWDCLFSPKLYKVYGARSINDGMYEPSHLERWGDQIISSLSLVWSVGVYTSPVLTYLMFRKGYFMFDGIISLAKFAVGISLLLAASYCLRSYGRINSPVYLEFQKALKAAKKDLNPSTKDMFGCYHMHPSSTIFCFLVLYLCLKGLAYFMRSQYAATFQTQI